MSDSPQGAVGPSHRSVELGVAVGTAIFAGLVIGGSIQAGVGWDFDGPRAGFFPFYLGLFVLTASVINFARAFTEKPKQPIFAEWGQLQRVLAVVLPVGIYVLVVPWIGIYIASAGLIAFFMRVIGRYGWGKLAGIAVAVPIVVFIIFEKWFLVPLPKGPLEAFLGY
jgi:hypothetical protein